MTFNYKDKVCFHPQVCYKEQFFSSVQRQNEAYGPHDGYFGLKRYGGSIVTNLVMTGLYDDVFALNLNGSADKSYISFRPQGGKDSWIEKKRANFTPGNYGTWEVNTQDITYGANG